MRGNKELRIQILVLILFSVLLCPSPKAEADWITKLTTVSPSIMDPRNDGVPILQGSTSESTANFRVDLPAGRFKIFARERGQENDIAPTISESVPLEGTSYTVRHIRFEGLNLRTEYELFVTRSDETFAKASAIVDRRFFRTLDTQKPRGKVSLMSCMYDQICRLGEPSVYDSFEDEGNRPDAIFVLGDVAYLDRNGILSGYNINPSESEMNVRFLNTRQRVPLYFLKRLIPIFSIWDDHDAGGNNCRGDSCFIEVAKKVYRNFMSNDPIEGVLKPASADSLGFSLNLFGHKWIFLDARTFRGGADQDYASFGLNQETFLIEEMESSTPGQMVFVFSGPQFFGDHTKKESYSYDFPKDFARFLRKISQVAKEKDLRLVLGSGDVHFSEVSYYQGAPGLDQSGVLEITGSAVHSGNLHLRIKNFLSGLTSWFKGSPLTPREFQPPNPSRLAATARRNAILLEVMRGRQLTLRSIGIRGDELFKLSIDLSGTTPVIKSGGEAMPPCASTIYDD